MTETLDYYPTGELFVIPRPLPEYIVGGNWIVSHLKHGRTLKICTIPLDCEGCRTPAQNSSCFEIRFTATVWSVKLTVSGDILTVLVSFTSGHQPTILVVHLDRNNQYEEYPGFGSNFDIKAVDGDILYTVHCIYSYQLQPFQQIQPFQQELASQQRQPFQQPQPLQPPQIVQSNIMQSLQVLLMPHVLETPQRYQQPVIPGMPRHGQRPPQQIQTPRPMQRPRLHRGLQGARWWPPQQVQQQERQIVTGNTVVTGWNLGTRQPVFRHQMRDCFREPALSKIYDGSLVVAAQDPQQNTYEITSIPDNLLYLNGQGYATDWVIKDHGIFYAVDDHEKFYSTFYGGTYRINLQDNDLNFPQEHLTIVTASDDGNSIWVSNSFDANDRYFIKYSRRHRQKSAKSFV